VDQAVVSAAEADHIPVVQRTSIDVDNDLYWVVKLHRVVEIAESDLMTLARMRLGVVVVRWMRNLDMVLHQVGGLVSLDTEGMCIPVLRGEIDLADT
jgi:hypothetical protein